MTINPFIISTVRDNQNETILTLDVIDKTQLIDSLYSFYEQLNEKESFFRIFKIRNSLAMVYYWNTNNPEMYSERCGLYVIIGFIIEEYKSVIGKPQNIMGIDYFCRHFFELIEKEFQISLQEIKSDQFFRLLQNKVDKNIETLQAESLRLRDSIPEFIHRHYLNTMIKFGKSRMKRCIYMLNESPLFTDTWSAFCREAFDMIYRYNSWDISTLNNFTPQTLKILENGSKVPSDFSRIWKKDYERYSYLLLEW